MLDCLKHMEEFDPAGAEMAEQQIWQEFAEGAGVPLATLKLAYRRVAFDGYYGPVSDDEWEEQDGDAMPLKEAIDILHRALETRPCITYEHPDYSDEELTVDDDAIRKSCFPAIPKIYGGWL